MNDVAIAVTDVSKEIGDDVILKNVSLQVPSGQIYGISGHNGAGKSMLLRVICGLVHPTSGQVRVFGQEIGKEVEFPASIGAVIDVPGFLPGYSALRNLQLLAMIRQQITKEEIMEALHRVGLDGKNHRPVRTYSTGMRQRLGIAQAIMEHPKLLILDEPTRGVDPEGIADLYDLFRELQASGVTILMTSHSEHELQELCSAIFVMNRGKLEVQEESVRSM